MKTGNFTLIAASLFVLQSAHATPVLWTLENVQFADGAVAQGNFTWNQDAANGSQLTDFNVSVTGGKSASFPNFTYTYANRKLDADTSSPGTQTFVRITAANSQSRELRLYFTQPLTDAGGPTALVIANPSDPYLTLFSGECFNCSPYRFIVSGAAVASIPEPDTLTLAALGLVAIAVTRKRLW